MLSFFVSRNTKSPDHIQEARTCRLGYVYDMFNLSGLCLRLRLDECCKLASLRALSSTPKCIVN